MHFRAKSILKNNRYHTPKHPFKFSIFKCHWWFLVLILVYYTWSYLCTHCNKNEIIDWWWKRKGVLLYGTPAQRERNIWTLRFSYGNSKASLSCYGTILFLKSCILVSVNYWFKVVHTFQFCELLKFIALVVVVVVVSIFFLLSCSFIQIWITDNRSKHAKCSSWFRSRWLCICLWIFEFPRQGFVWTCCLCASVFSK